VLATLSKLFNWYASRSDDFTSPVVKGMRRSAPAERARDRVLSHDEIKALWPVLGESGRFGAFVKVLLLTGQRRAKVAEMRWQDIAEDGMWTLPTEAREKNNPGALKLPDAVLDIIRAQMPIDGNPYVFPAARGDGPLSGFAKFKAAIDAKAKLPSWVLHDLRRTARSLMAEAGVRPDLAERVLGHAIAGVEGVYDRHTYTEERAVGWLESEVQAWLAERAASREVTAE
jgi:integrase